MFRQAICQVSHSLGWNYRFVVVFFYDMIKLNYISSFPWSMNLAEICSILTLLLIDADFSPPQLPLPLCSVAAVIVGFVVGLVLIVGMSLSSPLHPSPSSFALSHD